MRTHDELQSSIWNDERGLPPGTRELALAVAWVLHSEPEHKTELWKRVRHLTGRTVTGRWRIHELVAGDAPRYDHGQWCDGAGSCEGPRLRPYKPRRVPGEGRCWVSHHPHLGECRYTTVHGIDEGMPERDNTVCGAHGTIKVAERDMITGWETRHWFCSRHLERAREVKAQLAARGEPPEPIPNRGGLLPRYFAGDWPEIYRRHCEKACTHWRVPFHGVDADGWPVPGKTMIPKRPRLAVVADLPA